MTAESLVLVLGSNKKEEEVIALKYLSVLSLTYQTVLQLPLPTREVGNQVFPFISSTLVTGNGEIDWK